MQKNNNEKPNQMDMSGGPIGNSLNSDNSFSDTGLENEQKLRETNKNKTK